MKIKTPRLHSLKKVRDSSGQVKIKRGRAPHKPTKTVPSKKVYNRKKLKVRPL